MLYMLDTDTASYAIRGRSTAIEARLTSLQPSQICVSVMTRAELLYGLKSLPAEHRLHLAVQQILRIVRALSWNETAADYYADIRYQLVTSGQPIGEMDMMIAAHALASGAVLVTNNTRDYQRIQAPLMLENWKE
jgi:tRNA(fMet)-specific endonuclease VapC